MEDEEKRTRYSTRETAAIKVVHTDKDGEGAVKKKPNDTRGIPQVSKLNPGLPLQQDRLHIRLATVPC